MREITHNVSGILVISHIKTVISRKPAWIAYITRSTFDRQKQTAAA
jgi:hypothetical protein